MKQKIKYSEPYDIWKLQEIDDKLNEFIINAVKIACNSDIKVKREIWDLWHKK